MKRINSIDFTRGVVMVIMALDHTRYFMHTTSLSQDPANLHTTTAAVFLTRWITNLCAPIFVFLSGASAYISFKRTGNIIASKWFLLSRGIWLLILEFTIINFAIWYDIHFRMLILEVIYPIAIGFITLSFLLKVSPRIIGIVGCSFIIFSHNLLHALSFISSPVISFLSSMLFRPDSFSVTPNFTFVVGYPLIPWLGILLTGFACGKLFELPLEKRKKIFLQIGGAALLLFCIIRAVNIYGDPSKWAIQKTTLFTFLSFINVTKYPPSFLFSLLNLGIMFLLLFFAESVTNRLTNIFCVYGEVPLFYFIVHLYLVHSLMFIMLYLQGFGLNSLHFGIFNNGRPQMDSGVNLSTVYLIWLGVVIALYPLCKWYGKQKATYKNNKLLRYL
jgi:uncharacterized membrane protein